jgi:hypothetical protein
MNKKKPPLDGDTQTAEGAALPATNNSEGVDISVNRLASLDAPVAQTASIGGVPVEKPYDPFDLKAIRISQTILTGAAQKVISSYSVRKPHKNAFFRVHPDDENYSIESFIYTEKDEGGMEKDTYFVDRTFALQVEDADLTALFQRVILRLAIERHAEKPFVWPLKFPIAGGKDNEYWRSAREIAEQAKTEWIRMSASEGSYDKYTSRVQPPDPVWTTVPFGEILKIAFKGRLIDSKDHPVMKAFWGVE